MLGCQGAGVPEVLGCQGAGVAKFLGAWALVRQSARLFECQECLDTVAGSARMLGCWGARVLVCPGASALGCQIVQMPGMPGYCGGELMLPMLGVGPGMPGYCCRELML